MFFIVALSQSEKMIAFVRFVYLIYVKIYDILCLMPFVKNISKKLLTIYDKGGKISTLSYRTRLKTTVKIFLRNLKKGIDKGKEMWYNSQAVREKAGSGTVIEN